MSTLLDNLASYVSTLTLHHVAQDPTPLTAPRLEQFPAAVLFADISGFTTQAERLGAQGLAGVEELSEILNDYFGQLIALISEHGGDVVKFAGDALLAIWTGAALPTLVVRAAQCGLVIQRQLHRYEAAGGLRLEMRLAIGAGDAFTMHLGGVFGRWEFLIAGDPILQVSVASQRAVPGQVVLSAEAWALVQGTCRGEVLPEGDVRLDVVVARLPLQPLEPPVLDEQAEVALRAYIPGAILNRLLAGQGAGGRGSPFAAEADWLAELRRVSILFINLPDLNHHLPLGEAQHIMQTLQKALYRYEGSVNKLSVDDKGVTLLAALGLPPLAHEDDAARAVLAALDIRARLEELGVRSAIGIATGQVFCGAIGCATRREYTMIGDVVNLAARLMQAAPGAILCSATTFQAAQVRVAFEPLPPLRLKGKEALVPVYRPLGERQSAIRPPSEVVGRQHERAALATGIQNLVRSGSGYNVYVIEGEAGIGKSRLVEEVRRTADAMDITTLSGMGDAIEKLTPYYGWRNVFAQLFGLELFDHSERCRRHVRLALGPKLVRLVPLLNAVLPLDFPETEATVELTGQARADQTCALLVQLLQAAITRSPKVIILEDAHWLDSASWRLVVAVAQQVRPLLLVIATRPLSDPLPPEYRALIEAGNVQRLRLAPLSARQTLALVCQRLGVDTLPETVAALIQERAEGNPFFSEELAYALRDAGLIELVNGTCRLAPHVSDLRAAHFSDTVQGVIVSRIDQLAPPMQLTLKVASVIGRIFAFRTLIEVHPFETDQSKVAEHLQALERIDLVSQESPEPELAYIFKHIITQETVYNLMLFAQRRELHRAVAEQYERTSAQDVTAHYPVLAHHWSRAEVWSKAVAYRTLAGDSAARLFAYTEARLHYDGALEALSHLAGEGLNPVEQVDVLVRRVQVGLYADPPDQSLARLEMAERLLAELPGDDLRRHARIHYLKGRVHYIRNEFREAIGCYHRVLAVASELDDPEMVAVPALVLGQTMQVQGHFGKAVALLQQAIPFLEANENWPEWIRGVGFYGCALAAMGRYAEGLAQIHQALARAQRLGALAGIGHSMIYLTFAHLCGGDWPAMVTAANQVAVLGEQSGDHLFVYIGYGYWGMAEGRMGRVDEAMAMLARGQAVGESIGGRLLLADLFTAARAETASRAGQFNHAVALAEQAITMARAAGSIFTEGLAQRAWGEALVGLERWAEGEPHLAESLRLLETGECWSEAARTRLVWGRLALAHGHPDVARPHLAQALAQFEQSHIPAEAEQARALLATLG